MELILKEEKLETYSENQIHRYYYIDGLPKNIRCKLKIIYGYDFRDFNISPNKYYQTDVERKIIEKYTQTIYIGKYKATIYYINNLSIIKRVINLDEFPSLLLFFRYIILQNRKNI